jgi:hypothetical protein
MESFSSSNNLSDTIYSQFHPPPTLTTHMHKINVNVILPCPYLSSKWAIYKSFLKKQDSVRELRFQPTVTFYISQI